jgi:glycosyltransferase involved in cell wall biosynthesis
MRIAIAHSHLNALGGGEHATLELLRHLGRRHEVELWAGGFDSAHTFPELAEYPRRDLAALSWLTLRPRTDVVVAQTFGAYLLALRHPRTLCYLHTLRSRYLRVGVRPDLLARRTLDHLAILRADALLANSHYTAARARHRYGRPVRAVPPGADEALFALPEQIGSYALYVGRLAPEKGVERLLRWISPLPVDMLVVGDGSPDYLAHLRALAGPRVRFAGSLLGPELAAAYAGARFLAFVPHEEEFGLAAVEAMAASKPVVAAPEGGLIELVRAGETGLFARDAQEFAAATRRLMGDDALCSRMGRAGRLRGHAFTWERFSRGVEAVCEEAVESCGRHACRHASR